jgi:hypothetical protein
MARLSAKLEVAVYKMRLLVNAVTGEVKLIQNHISDDPAYRALCRLAANLTAVELSPSVSSLPSRGCRTDFKIAIYVSVRERTREQRLGVSNVMAKVAFRIIGGVAIFYSCGLFFVATFVPRFSSSGLSLVTVIAYFVPVAVLGVGLLYLRKWAAVGLSILFLYPAFWCISTAVHPIPGNANWLGFVFAALLICASIVTAVYWRQLTWRKKLNGDQATTGSSSQSVGLRRNC